MADDQLVIAIRDAEAADAEALASVGLTSFKATYEGTASEEDMATHLERYFSAEAVRAEMGRSDQGYLVAAVDAEPVGLAKWRQGYCPDEVPASDSIEIQQLYVLPERQGFGIGGRLVEAVIHITKKHAAHGIWLSVWEHADWAIGFYRKIGFREIGKTGFSLGKTQHTDLLLWLPVEVQSRCGAVR